MAASKGASALAEGALACGAFAPCDSLAPAPKKRASAQPSPAPGSRDACAHKSGASALSCGLIASPSLVPKLVEHPDQHSYLSVGNPGEMRAFGPFAGEISPFVVQTGRLPDGVLDWLRGDDVFGNKANKVRASWNPGPKTRNLERDCKLEVGILGNKGKQIQVNKIKCNLPFERLKIFLDEFRLLNKGAFESLGAQIADKLSVLTAEVRSLNGKQLMQENPVEWVFEANTMQFMRSSSRFDPIHFDGGASFLLMGLGLWGSRYTHLIYDKPPAAKKKAVKKGKVKGAAASSAVPVVVKRRPAAALPTRKERLLRRILKKASARTRGGLRTAAKAAVEAAAKPKRNKDAEEETTPDMVREAVRGAKVPECKIHFINQVGRVSQIIVHYSIALS